MQNFFKPFYPFNQIRLNEAHGTPVAVEDIVNRIIDEINAMNLDDSESFTENFNVNISDISFFNSVNIELKYVKSDKDADEYEAGYASNDMPTSDKNIRIWIKAEDTFLNTDNLIPVLYHEFLHAYEDKMLKDKYGYGLKRKSESEHYSLWVSILNKLPILLATEAISKPTYIFASLMYYFASHEGRARMSQIKGEYLKIAKNVSDLHDLQYKISNTPSYRVLKAIEQMVQELDKFSNKDIDTVVDELSVIYMFNNRKNSKIYLSDIDSLSDGDIDNIQFDRSTINRLKKYIITSWTKYQRKYRDISSKLIYDIFYKQDED